MENISLLVSTVNKYYNSFTDFNLLHIMCRTCDDLFKIRITRNNFDMDQLRMQVWISFQVQAFYINSEMLDEEPQDTDTGSYIEEVAKQLLKSTMSLLGGLDEPISKIQQKTQAVEEAEETTARQLFIAELFTVAVRDIHGHVYDQNLKCGNKGCDPLVLKAINTMVAAENSKGIPGVHPLLPASAMTVEDLKELAYFCGLSVKTSPQNTTTQATNDNSLGFVRRMLHSLLNIYKNVATDYKLEVSDLTRCISEKQRRNEVVHYSRAIQEYAFNPTNQRLFSLQDFLDDHKHQLLARAYANDQINLGVIFSKTCHFLRRSWNRR
jgi:hypothetical protein